MRRHSPIRDAAVVADANDRAAFAERLGKTNPMFSQVAHIDIASAQLLEMLQLAGNGKPLDVAVAYDHFTLALGHIAAARGDNARWFCSDPEPGVPATSLELLNAARDAGDTIGDQARASNDGLTGKQS